MSILIKNRQNHPIPVQKIYKVAQILLNDLGYPNSELSILITDDSEISKLNKIYLNKDRPTNVISFSMNDDDDFCKINHNLMGDVVISVDTAKREASCNNMDVTTRFVELLIHGVLHLVGYDHLKSKQEAIKMNNMSKNLLKLVQAELL